MTPVHDTLEMLRDERPAMDPRDPLARPRCTEPPAQVGQRPVTRRTVRVALVAAVACAAVFTGVVAFDDGPEGTRRAVGISSAEAREIAIDALQGVARLRDYTSASSWRATETDGDRSSGSGYTYSRVKGATSYHRWNENGFADAASRGVEHRIVGNYHYEGRGTSSFVRQPWLIDVRNGWHEPGRSFSHAFSPEGLPNFGRLIAQLEREDLIGARRTKAGTTIVTIERPARDLAPITQSFVGNDPIAMFAAGFTHGPKARPDTVVAIRLEVHDDGELRLHAEGTGPMTHPDGRGGTIVESVVEIDRSWRPWSEAITAPAKEQVLVVGNVSKAKRGATGVEGPLGTLDKLGVADLRRYQQLALAKDREAMRARMAARPSRSYPRYFARRMEEMAAFKKAAADLMPFNRSSYVDDPDCVPLWPESRRAMDAETARSDPDAAGWRCDLGEALGTVVIMPSPSGIVEWNPPSGGTTGWGADGYRPR